VIEYSVRPDLNELSDDRSFIAAILDLLGEGFECGQPSEQIATISRFMRGEMHEAHAVGKLERRVSEA